MGGINGQKHPRNSRFQSHPKRSGGGGGRPPRPGDTNYMLAMEAGLIAVLLLGWRILAELSRIRRVMS